jgi:protein-disulfide isomerase
MKSKPILLIVAILVVVAAAAVFYFVSRPDTATLPESAANSTPAPAATTPAPQVGGDLMTAGPLGEKALGKPDAPNVVVEYASLTCSHCQRFATEVFPAFKAKYIDTGKVYFIMREYPLDPLATAAVMLARCAPGDQYFPLVDLLFEQQRNWAFVSDPQTALFNMVKQAGFTRESFEACLKDQKILDGVNEVKNRGTSLGVDATPTFFFNGVKKPGVQSMEDIDKLLAD